MEEVFQFQCPFCGEINDSFFDLSQGSSTYIEDCQICCRPINLYFSVQEDGSFSVDAQR
ncbi:CPXCG motif-containing cysteine-rich protein [Pseudobacteriovorax antillogorgiicola]|uniref:Cysteine-rich CPXCG n=1 Tax=Pseudobacteriovorax antillogorgiicola TaxID=1513793 RepID=A0A1Y6B5V3_9BACT|nr:cysteine-rich CPXCG protein [Pseudobacteriovorax antillogorgiicola]SME93819.1 Cysteine-rich CPXCG [Pseudobacteriovorax antillogorgiicola]